MLEQFIALLHVSFCKSFQKYEETRILKESLLRFTKIQLQKNKHKVKTFFPTLNSPSHSTQACGYQINTNPTSHSATASGLSTLIRKVDGPSYGALSPFALQQNHKCFSQGLKFLFVFCALPGAHGNSQKEQSL